MLWAMVSMWVCWATIPLAADLSARIISRYSLSVGTDVTCGALVDLTERLDDALESSE